MQYIAVSNFYYRNEYITRGKVLTLNDAEADELMVINNRIMPYVERKAETLPITEPEVDETTSGTITRRRRSRKSV